MKKKPTREQKLFLESASKIPAIAKLASDLVEEGYSAIEKLCEQKQAETLFIEFKQPNNASSPVWSVRDSEYLGKSLSGFSNAEGGLLIWGIKTEKLSGVDVAKEITPIVNLGQFFDKLRSLIGGYLSPPNDDITTCMISTPNSVDCGLVVVCIPKGQNRPYRSNAQNTHNYYRKTSESIIRMEHYEIADLFTATKSPVLSVRKVLKQSAFSDANLREYEISFWIKNEGFVGAEQPFVWISHPPKVSISNEGIFSRPSTLSIDGRTKLHTPPSYNLFPDDEICAADFKVHPVGNEFFLGRAPNGYESGNRQRVAEMDITIWFGAKNAYRKEVAFQINDALLLSEIAKL